MMQTQLHTSKRGLTGTTYCPVMLAFWQANSRDEIMKGPTF